MKKIRVGDTVQVMTGKDKGLTGKVLRFIEKTTNPAQGLWVMVEGVNKRTKHIKPNPQANNPGGIVTQEAPVHVSNVRLVNATTGKSEKVGIRTLEDGKFVRYFKTTGEVVNV